MKIDLKKTVPLKAALGVLVSAVAVAAALVLFFLTHPAPAPAKTATALASAATPAPEPLTPFVFEAFDPKRAKTYLLDEEFITDPLVSFSPFYILLDMETGLFQYYETPISSYIGLGAFKLDGDLLTLDDSYRVNRFRVESAGEALVWIAEGSDNFMFAKLTDGARFSLDHTLVSAETSAAE